MPCRRKTRSSSRSAWFRRRQFEPTSTPLPFDLVMVPKTSNSAGLQLADLIARPHDRVASLAPTAANRASDILKTKFHQDALFARLERPAFCESPEMRKGPQISKSLAPAGDSNQLGRILSCFLRSKIPFSPSPLSPFTPTPTRNAASTPPATSSSARCPTPRPRSSRSPSPSSTSSRTTWGRPRAEELGGTRKFFAGGYARLRLGQKLDAAPGIGGHAALSLYADGHRQA